MKKVLSVVLIIVVYFIVFFSFKIVNANTNNFNVCYRTHIQNIGWEQENSRNGQMAGTSGKSLRLEAINVQLENQPYSGDIEYCTHVQNIGWQDFVKNGEMAGTYGKSLRLEAIKIRLTGEIADYYNIYYRVHCQNIGWMDWAKNGEAAGSAGYSYRLEAIEIVVLYKGNNPPTRTNKNYNKAYKCHQISYRTHVQNVGWQNYVYDGEMAGTSGRSLRLEGINIKLENQPYSGNIEYCTHVQNIGWQGFVKNGAMSGTSGKSLRLEAIKIRLTGEIANYYDVYYRVHCQNIGWMDWVKNGEIAGTSGKSLRLEGINIKLVEKSGIVKDSEDQKEVKVSLDKHNVVIKKDKSNYNWLDVEFDLKATVEPRYRNKDLKWSITGGNDIFCLSDWFNNPEQRTVREYDGGRYDCSQELPTVIIEASVDGKKDTCTLSFEGIQIKGPDKNEGNINLKYGDKKKVDYNILGNKKVNLKWKSSDTSIISVDNFGNIEAVGTGQAYIEIEDSINGYYDRAYVMVWDLEPKDIIVEKTRYDLYVGESIKIKGRVVPDNVNIGKRVYFEQKGELINNTYVINGDYLEVANDWENGATLTGRKEGKVIVLAKAYDRLYDNTISPYYKMVKEIEVNIHNRLVDEIVLNKTLDVKTGDSFELDAKVLPTNATNKNIKWEIADDSIISMTEYGKFLAKKSGKTEIIAKSEDGNATSKCTVNITDVSVEGIELNKTEKEIQVGQEYQLQATITPTNATNKKIKWSSSDDSIVTVDGFGKIVGIKKGNATVYAKTLDGDFEAACNVTVVNPPLVAECDISYILTSGVLDVEAVVSGGSGEYTYNIKLYKNGELIRETNQQQLMLWIGYGSGTYTAELTVTDSEGTVRKSTAMFYNGTN